MSNSGHLYFHRDETYPGWSGVFISRLSDTPGQIMNANGLIAKVPVIQFSCSYRSYNILFSQAQNVLDENLTIFMCAQNV